MIPVKHIDPEDLPLYAMKLLPPEEMEELTLQLQHSVEARKVLAEIYAELSAFAASAEMNDPPAIARQRLMKAVANEKKVIPEIYLERQAAALDIFPARPYSAMPDEEVVPKGFAQKSLPWLGWAIAAGLGVFATTQYQDKQHLLGDVASEARSARSSQLSAENASAALNTLKDPTAVHALLTSAEAKPQPSGRVSYVANRGSLIFVATNLAPLKADKAYELWVIPADGREPMPAGIFRPDEHGYASVVMPELIKGVTAKAFGVTVEDAEGSSTPTAPVLLKGSPS